MSRVQTIQLNAEQYDFMYRHIPIVAQSVGTMADLGLYPLDSMQSEFTHCPDRPKTPLGKRLLYWSIGILAAYAAYKIISR